jgi:SAM-dependent methyltransferase
MFFELEAALATLPALGRATVGALRRLLPGAVTVLLPNPERLFPLACGEDPETLGLRVVAVPELSGLAIPVMQSSANLSGRRDARSLAEVDPALLAGVDLVVDGGVLPGVASTVLDLRRFEAGGFDGWQVLRAGAVPDEEVAAAVAGQFHFDPATYLELIRGDLPAYDEFQTTVVDAGGSGAASILELGTGTGETARRLLARNPAASLVGVDESGPMLESAREGMSAAGYGERASMRIGRLQDPLPDGPFALVASALCVHHLTPAEKADLFVRVRRVLVRGGRFVLGDVIVPIDPAAATTSLTPGYDRPDTIADQLEWLADAGFEARVVWERGDLVVIVADASS